MKTKSSSILAYRCPICGSGVMTIPDALSLSAPMLRLRCDCGGSEMSITRHADGRISLDVPCLICPKPHTFTLAPNVLHTEDTLALRCPCSDMNICFIGDEDHVKAELARGELELMRLMEENGVADLSSFRRANEEDDEALDSELTQSVLFVLSELEAEKRIFCRCPRGDGKEEIDPEKYGFEIRAGEVVVSCRDCGAQRVIPTDNSLNTHAFLDSDALYLE